MLNPDWTTVDEIERKWREVAKPAMEDTIEVVAGIIENMPELIAELRRLDAENDRLRAERDALIAAWPGRLCRAVYRDPSDGKFRANDGRDRVFDTREDAVRAAAGLPVKEGGTH